MDNGKEILNQIKKIKEDYEAQPVSLEEEQLSFLDRMNKLIRLILNDESASIYLALKPEALERWKKRRLSRWLKKIISNPKGIFYFLLLLTITSFLVSEALSFYSVSGVVSTKTYIKAILTEVCFIFLSGYKTSNKMEFLWVGFLRFCIFSLMLFVISSETLLQGAKNSSNTGIISQQITVLEQQIKNKEKSIEYYRNKNWGVTTKQLIKEKDKMVDKLIILREKQASGANKQVSSVEKYKTYGKAFFRVLLLFISILITRRIFVF